MKILNNIDNTYVPQWGNKKQFIVLHYLGVVGQNNKIERNGCGAHFYIYWDGTVYQAVSLDAVVWQVGTAGYYKQLHPVARNNNCIGIELCPKCDGDSSRADDPYWYITEETKQSAVELVKYLMKTLNISTGNVLRHGDVVDKICPAFWMKDYNYKTSGTWAQFKQMLIESKPEPVPEEKPATSFRTVDIGMTEAGMVVCVNTNLNIRNNPETGSVVGKFSKGTVVFPTQRTVGGDFSAYWYKTEKGWICGDYLSGWVLDKANNKWWYNKLGKAIYGGWEFIGSNWHYFDKDGYMVSDTVLKDKNKKRFYYVDKSGKWDGKEVVDISAYNVVEY